MKPEDFKVGPRKRAFPTELCGQDTDADGNVWNFVTDTESERYDKCVFKLLSFKDVLLRVGN